MTNTTDSLIIIPCGARKIWHSEPGRRSVRARDAYTGAPFRLNLRFAKHFEAERIILSAKYGFIQLDHIIEDYDVTFARTSTKPISPTELVKQVDELQLARFSRIIALGGKHYRQAVREAFTHTNARVIAPFKGLPVGRAMQATRRAIERFNSLHELIEALRLEPEP